MATIKKVVAKKPLAKKQAGGATKKKETPFQEGVRKKDFKASDTTGMASMGRSYSIEEYNKKWGKSTPKNNIAIQNKIDSNKKLEKAYKKTYGTSNVIEPLFARDAIAKGDNYTEKKFRKPQKRMGGATKKKC